MANASLKTEICGMCDFNLILVKDLYKNFNFCAMVNLATDFIIGDGRVQHQKI